ncbi:MAG: hypothetical protein Q8P06_01565, partial [Candidatus Azambacteria bacterium]|nr:hypothetical protein [Candidatus Azambacteria bacterium]
MNKRKVFFGGGILIAIFIAGWLVFTNGAGQFSLNKEITGSSENIQQKVFLTIDDSESVKNFEMNFETGMTAFDLLKNKAEE